MSRGDVDCRLEAEDSENSNSLQLYQQVQKEKEEVKKVVEEDLMRNFFSNQRRSPEISPLKEKKRESKFMLKFQMKKVKEDVVGLDKQLLRTRVAAHFCPEVKAEDFFKGQNVVERQDIMLESNKVLSTTHKPGLMRKRVIENTHLTPKKQPAEI